MLRLQCPLLVVDVTLLLTVLLFSSFAVWKCVWEAVLLEVTASGILPASGSDTLTTIEIAELDGPLVSSPFFDAREFQAVHVRITKPLQLEHD